MKDLVVLILVLMILFFIWNRKQEVSTYSVEDAVQELAVSPEITQAILSKALKDRPELVPIDTVFINPKSDGEYHARIMFFNTEHYFGVQYDILAKVSPDGRVDILSFGDSPKTEANGGYTEGKYQEWKAVTDNLDAQFKGALEGYRNNPPQPNLVNIEGAYKSQMLTAPVNLQTRA